MTLACNGWRQLGGKEQRMSTSSSELKQESAVTPIPLMQMATAFWAFKTLATAVDMDLFTQLSATPMTAAEMAKWFRIEERPAEMLLTGCAGLGLLSKQNGRYGNTPVAEKFLVRGGGYFFGCFVTMLNRRLYSGWDKLPEAISTNRPTTWNPDEQVSLFEGADPAMMQTFGQAMHSLSIFTARALADMQQVTDRFVRLGVIEAAKERDQIVFQDKDIAVLGIPPDNEWRIGRLSPASGKSESERQIFDSQVRAGKELLMSWEHQDDLEFTAYIPKKVRGGRLTDIAGSLCAVGEAFDKIEITALKYWYGRDWKTKIPNDDVILAEFPLTVPVRIRWGYGAHLVVSEVKPVFAC
jgi:Dimerisation domain